MLKTPKSLIVSILFLALAFISCGKTTPHTSEVLIYGGKPVETDAWMAVVAVTRRNDAIDSVICTGTLIGPKHVLTAGHCVDDKALRENDPTALAKLGILIGSGSEGGNVQRTLTVKSVSVSEALRLHPSGNSDIALIELDEDVLTVTPVKLLASITQFQQKFMTKTPTKTGLLVGYGRREDGGQGVKFMVDAAIRDVNTWESIAGSDGKDSCNGDSGGPSFVKDETGEWLQYGTVSRSWTFECGKGGFITNVAPHACWIEQKSGIKTVGTSTQCTQQTKNYSDLELSKIDFLQICQGKKANKFQKETLERLKLRFGTKSCQELELVLKGPTLKLNDLSIRDLSILAPFKDVTDLQLSNNLISDASVLTKFTLLKTLDISANNVAKPDEVFAPMEAKGVVVLGKRSQLQNYAQTTFLALCKKADLGPEPKKTVKVIFAKTMADDCETANSRLLTIKTLSLSERSLTDLTPLTGLPKLSSLDISKNPVGDVSPLADLEQLKSLNLIDTQVTDVSVLAKLQGRGLTIKQ